MAWDIIDNKDHLYNERGLLKYFNIDITSGKNGSILSLEDRFFNILLFAA